MNRSETSASSSYQPPAGWRSPTVVDRARRERAAEWIERGVLALGGAPIPEDAIVARWVRNLRSYPTLRSARNDKHREIAAYGDLVLAIRLADALEAIVNAGDRCRVSPTVVRNQLFRQSDDPDMPKGHAELHVAAEFLEADAANRVEVFGCDPGGEGRDLRVSSPAATLDVEVRCRQFVIGVENDADALVRWITSSAIKKAAGFTPASDGRRVVALDVACRAAPADAALDAAIQQLANRHNALHHHRVAGILVWTIQLDPDAGECGFSHAPRFYAIDDLIQNDPAWCGLSRLVTR